MSMQSKAQMVEAVVFFNEQGGIGREMLWPEFEAVLDGVVNMPECADKQMQAVYVLINPRLLVRAAVFFLLDFDEKGSTDPGWNLPLRHLADKAGRGPDLGAGPIRLACRSQCPVSWHQMHLWDPSLAPTRNDLVLLRDAIKRNSLGLLVEEEPIAATVVAERLNMASEDKWHSPAEQAKTQQQAQKLEHEHRQKTAQLLKQQRLRIASLSKEHEAELAKFRLASEEKAKILQIEIHQLHEALRQQEELNQSLKDELTEHAETVVQLRTEMDKRVQQLAAHGQTESGALRKQFEAELKSRVAAAVAEYKEQVAVRDVELAYRAEQETQLLKTIEQLKQEKAQIASQSGGQVLERLSKLGVVFVAFHPGAGHLTIPLQEVARYQDNPFAYVAAKCFVSEQHYRQWLEHYQKPVCQAQQVTGEPCAIPIDRVDSPSRFVAGDSNCCSRHKSARLRPHG